MTDNSFSLSPSFVDQIALIDNRHMPVSFLKSERLLLHSPYSQNSCMHFCRKAGWPLSLLSQAISVPSVFACWVHRDPSNLLSYFEQSVFDEDWWGTEKPHVLGACSCSPYSRRCYSFRGDSSAELLFVRSGPFLWLVLSCYGLSSHLVLSNAATAFVTCRVKYIFSWFNLIDLILIYYCKV